MRSRRRSAGSRPARLRASAGPRPSPDRDDEKRWRASAVPYRRRCRTFEDPVSRPAAADRRAAIRRQRTAAEHPADRAGRRPSLPRRFGRTLVVLLAGLRGLESSHEAGLAPGSVVGVDHTSAGGAIEGRLGGADELCCVVVAVLDGQAGVADGAGRACAHRAIAIRAAGCSAGCACAPGRCGPSRSPLLEADRNRSAAHEVRLCVSSGPPPPLRGCALTR